MKYFALTVLSFLIISCDYKVEKTIDFNSSSDAEVEFYSSEETIKAGYPFSDAVKINDLIILSGDYVFYNNAAVLQTNNNVYGIIINEKVNELNDKLSSIKKDEFDFIPVILKGRLKNKDKNDEGWSVKLEITEIVEIILK